MAEGGAFTSAPWMDSPGVPLDFNGPTHIPYTPYNSRWFDRPLIEVIGELARRLPSQIAVDDGAVRLTYPQLYAMACRLGQAIGQAGLPPGAVGVQLPNDAFYVVAMLGCLAAGRPCLLLSEDSPPDYRRRLIVSAGLKGLIVPAKDAREPRAPGAPVPIAIETALVGGQDGCEQPFAPLGADDAAFLISTSGSTGEPKLIAWPQAAVQRRAASRIEAGHYNERDRLLLVGAPATGTAISWRFIPLMVGATLRLIDVPRAGIGGVRRILRDERITSTRGTMSFLKALIDGDAADFASLRLLWGGGEPLLREDFARMRARLPAECYFANAMNMTEGPIAQWFVSEERAHDPILVGAGYLVPGTQALVLDDEERPCRPGELGELVVRSRDLALGEWRDGRIVADRFQRDPVDPARRILRTGDMVRLYPDGMLVVHGRKDRMVKVRGHRVEPAVIEDALRHVPGVSEAAVAARLAHDGARLYGFVVPRGNGDGLAARVDRALRAALPAHMQPAAIVMVPSLPTNLAGKIDTNALLAQIPTSEEAVREPIPSAPATTTPPPHSDRAAEDRSRRMVAAAWRAVLGRRMTDEARGFEDAGGDSLRLMQFVFQLEQSSGLSLPLSLFELSMTADEMARALDGALRGAQEAPPQHGRRVFLLPGIGGNEPRLQRLSAACAPELAIAVLEFGDWADWLAENATFEDVIDRLAAEIGAQAPAGPLLLAGYSIGGHAAFAVAAKLHAQGRRIERLLVLDCDALGAERRSLVVAHETSARAAPTRRLEFARWREASRRGEGTFALAYIITRRLLSPRGLPLLRWLSSHRSLLYGRIGFYLVFHLRSGLLSQLATKWRASQLTASAPFPITLFRTARPGEARLADGGWHRHTASVTVVPVGGDHFTMFDPPHLDDLCAEFRAACRLPADQRAACGR